MLLSFPPFPEPFLLDIRASTCIEVNGKLIGNGSCITIFFVIYLELDRFYASLGP